MKDTLYQVVTENQYYDKTKEVDVFVDSFGDSSIKMGVRCMVATENYWKANGRYRKQSNMHLMRRESRFRLTRWK